MSDKNTPGIAVEVNIRSKNSTQPSISTPDETPFCMAVLGNFSACFDHSNVALKPLADRKPILVDRDNFDQVLARIKPSFNVSPKGNAEHGITIEIADMDDFHPDALYEKLEVFNRLRSIRRRLKNNNTFEAAASEIMGWLVEEEESTQTPSEDSPQQQEENRDPTVSLDNVLEMTQPSYDEVESIIRPGGVDRLVKSIVAPYVEKRTNPRQQEMLAAVDNATADHMRQILHHPHFQSVEGAWRSLYFLISRIETGQDLKIFMLDITRQELEQDLGGDVNDSVLNKLFCDAAVNDIPWSLLVGDFTFEDKINDVLMLSQLGRIANEAHAVFLAGARETLAGCEAFARFPDADDWHNELKTGMEKAWALLRQDPLADAIGLALPRFLLRLPYGRKTRPIEAFSFEEIINTNSFERHQRLLWGNAAFIKAEQLARSFSVNRWNFQMADSTQTDKLPMYYFDEDGEIQSMPCAEIYLTEKGGRRLSEQGLIPLWSVKNSDMVKSSSFNALSADGKDLQGRWVKQKQ